MIRSVVFIFILLSASAALAPVAAAACADTSAALPISRVVEIDSSGGPLFGSFTSQAKENRFLAPKEVILTFDDGPMPWITTSILDTLDKFCTKATFFSVGRMAIAYPKTVRAIVARGHTLGAHTMSHPFNLRALRPDKSRAEIERGFAAIAAAAGTPIAPFFRFPGLSDNAGLLSYLQQHKIATFSVDAVSNDSYIHDPAALAQFTLAQIEQSKGGIVLFHDIKVATAKALPLILKELKARGYSVVHMRAKAPYQPNPDFVADYEAKIAKRAPSVAATPVDPTTAQDAAIARPPLMPFYGHTGPERVGENVTTSALDVPVTEIAPEPKERGTSKTAKAVKPEASPAPQRAPTAAAAAAQKPAPKLEQKTSSKPTGEFLPWQFITGWATELKPAAGKSK